MDIHAVFFMVKDLFKKLFLHSPKRTFFVVGGLIVMLSLPVTILLSQQSQDIRQRASGIEGGYPNATETRLEGWAAPSQYASGYQCAVSGCTERYTCAYGEYQPFYEYFRDTTGTSHTRLKIPCPTDSTCRSVNIGGKPGIQCVPKEVTPSCNDIYEQGNYSCTTQDKCGSPNTWYEGRGTICKNFASNYGCCKTGFNCYDINCGTGTTCAEYTPGANRGICIPIFSKPEGAYCGGPQGPNTSVCSLGLFCNSNNVCAKTSTGGGGIVTPPSPTPTPTPALPSVGAVKVFNCEAGLTNPGDIIFGWTRQEWGLNYEVRWGSTQSYSEKLTFGETSQTNVISGFTPGRVVYYSIRAYRGTVAGPSSTGQFTVKTSCPTSSGGTGTTGSPAPQPVAPTPIPGTATQGQTCDNNHFSSEYPGCNTSIKNAEGNSLTCGMYNGMPFGVCNFFTQTACQGGIGSLANGKPCGCPEDCQSGICEQYSGGVVSVSTFCQAPKTPPKPPAPTVADDPCSVTSNKPTNCSCSASNQCSTNFCDTGSVGRTGTYKCTTPIAESTKPPTPTNSPTPTTRPGLTCDPNKDGKIDTLDFQWLKDEMGGTRTTKVADCFKADGVVNALDFQVWKDINFGKKPAF